MSENATRMIKHSSIYAIGNISRQLVGFIMLPVYTRYLTPADYGVVGILTISLSLIDIFFGARLFQAIPKFYHAESDEIRQNTVISTALLITSTISLVTFIALLLSRDISAMLMFGRDDLSLVVAIYSTLILTQAIENYGLLYIRLQQKPFLFLGFNLGKLAFQLGMNIWLIVYLEMGVLGVVITAASATIIMSSILMFYTFYHTKIHWCFDIAKRLIIFSWPLWIAAFATLYTTLINRYALRIFSSLDDVGLLELAAKFQSIILLIIWQPINQYWQTERFKYYEEGKPAPAIYQSVFLVFGTIILLSALAVSILAGPTIKIMAHSSYYGAIEIVPYLTIAVIFSCGSVYLQFSFLATGHTAWISKNNFITAAISTVTIFALIPFYGYIGAAISIALTFIAQFVLTALASRKYYDMKLKYLPMIYMLLIGVIAYLAAYYVPHPASVILEIIIKVAILAVASVAIALIMWRHTTNKDTFKKLFIKMLPNKFRKNS